MSSQRNLLTSSYTSRSLSFVYSDEEGDNEYDSSSSSSSDSDDGIEVFMSQMKRATKRRIPIVQNGKAGVPQPKTNFCICNEYDDDEIPEITSLTPPQSDIKMVSKQPTFKKKVNNKKQKKGKGKSKKMPYFNDPNGCISNAADDNDTEFAKLEKANVLDCENDKHGNIEYKFKLVGVTAERKVHLATQMQFRLCEGHGEAIYEIGVHDNGTPMGLSQAELDETVDTLRELGATLNADVSVMRVMAGIRGRVAEVLVRQRKTSPHDFSEVRVAVIGPFDAGKTTLLSVLLSGKKDDGRGKARTPMLHHRHEIISGVTSSIGHAYLGFTSKGDAVEVKCDQMAGTKFAVAGNDDKNTFVDDDAMAFFDRSSESESERGLVAPKNDKAKADLRDSTSAFICTMSSSLNSSSSSSSNPICNSSDSLCGTKAQGDAGNDFECNFDDDGDDDDDDVLDLLGCKNDPYLNEDMSEVVKRIHFIDLCGHKKYMKTTLYGLSANRLDCIMLVIAASAEGSIDDATIGLIEISKVLGLPLVLVVTKTDLCSTAAVEGTCRHLRTLLQAPGMYRSLHRVECEEDLSCWKPPDPSVVPLFCVSNVTLANVGLLVKFFNMVPASENWGKLSRRPVEFIIDASWDFAEGTVFSGTLTNGTLVQGHDVCIGPDTEGCFKTVRIDKILNGDATPTERMFAGQYGSALIERTEIKPGMVVIADFMFQTSCYEFEVELLTQYDKRCFTVGSEYVAHCNAVKQTVRVISNDSKDIKEEIEVNDKEDDKEVKDEEVKEKEVNNNILKRPIIKLCFIQHPEYIPVGNLVIFREGITKGLGKVIRITPFYPKKVTAMLSQSTCSCGAPPEQNKALSMSGIKSPSPSSMLHSNGSDSSLSDHKPHSLSPNIY